MNSLLKVSVLAFLLLTMAVAEDATEAADSADSATVASDAFAGKTVKNAQMGRSLMRARSKHVPKLGQVAPDFELPLYNDKEKKITLSNFKNKTPVVLVFGSYT